MITAIVAVVSAVGGGAIAAFFKWLTDRKPVQADVWQKLYNSYSERLDRLQREVGGLDAQVKDLKVALDREEKRSDAAIGYIRVLRRWIGERYPGEDVPQVPGSLRNDV